MGRWLRHQHQAWLDLPVRIGRPLNQAQLQQADWTILITNTPASLLHTQEVLVLARALTGVLTLPTAIRQIATGIAAGCRLNRRRQAPNTAQLLLTVAAGA